MLFSLWVNANIKSWLLGEIHLFTKMTSHLDIIVSSLIISHHFIQTSSGCDTSEVRCTRSTRSHHPADNTPNFFWYGSSTPNTPRQWRPFTRISVQARWYEVLLIFFLSLQQKKNTYVGSATDYFPHYKAADWRRLLMTFDLSGYSLPTFQTSGCATRRPVKKDCPSLEAWMKLANTKYGLY